MTLTDQLTRWLAENMEDDAYTPAGLAKFAIEHLAVNLGQWQTLRISLGRITLGIPPETTVGYHGIPLDAWYKLTWQVALREKIVENLPPRKGRSWRYLFLIVRVEATENYTPGLLIKSMNTTDVQRFNERYGLTLGLEEIRQRARIALGIFRRTHITVSHSGMVKLHGQTEIKGWTGNIWLSAFGLLNENNLHTAEKGNETDD